MPITVQTAEEIIENVKNTKGIYVWGGTGENGGWDCSGFVGHCVGAAIGERVFITDYEGAELSKAGFKDMSNNVDFKTGAGMKKGDILIRNPPGGTTGRGHSGHTEIYWGSGTSIGARLTGQPVGIEGGTVGLLYKYPTLWEECWRAPRSGVYIKSVTGNLNS